MVRTKQKQKRLRRGGKNTQKNYTRVLNDPDNHNDVGAHLEPDILECEVKQLSWNSVTSTSFVGSGAS